MSAHYDQPGSLMKKTLALIEEQQCDPLKLHKETGLPYYWLKKFASGSFKNPSVNRVEFLYERLTGNQIAI